MPQTVLIVDDHPSFRSCVRLLLEEEGFTVVGEAENGGAALDAVRALSPDLVILDVQLPDANGFELCELLGADGSVPQVVLVSSRDAADYNGLIDSSCARGFIGKADLSGDTLRSLLG